MFYFHVVCFKVYTLFKINFSLQKMNGILHSLYSQVHSQFCLVFSSLAALFFTKRIYYTSLSLTQVWASPVCIHHSLPHTHSYRSVSEGNEMAHSQAQIRLYPKRKNWRSSKSTAQISRERSGGNFCHICQKIFHSHQGIKRRKLDSDMQVAGRS